jgi:hypothetical protein
VEEMGCLFLVFALIIIAAAGDSCHENEVDLAAIKACGEAHGIVVLDNGKYKSCTVPK